MVARWFIAATALSFGSAWAAGLTAYQLECGARRDPVGIEAANPRLSWKLNSDNRGDSQTAYEILVAGSAAKLRSGVGDLWGSGRVASSETAWVPYAGAPLRSFQHCWWKVRVWSALGGASAWTEPAEWTMGITDVRDRKGGWISTPTNVLRSGPMPLFRHEFVVNRPLRRALAFVSGLGFDELRIDGAKVGNDVLAPAWTNFRETVYYESYDVTKLLRPGANAIGVMLGNGFYNVVGGRYAKYTGSFGAPRLWLQVHLEFNDGSSTDIATNLSWKVHDGPIMFSDTYGGEDFDARREPQGWDRPGFDDSGWAKAGNTEAPGGLLTADFSPPARVRETFDPVRVSEPKPGVFVYDLGQNFAGWPEIVVSGPAGASVRLTPGELVDSSGMVSQRSSGGGPTYFTYILRGSGTEKWSPRFSYYGFRYVQVDGAAPESAKRTGIPVLHSLRGQFLYLDVEQTGRFSSSNKTLNEIHRLIDVAAKSNLQHVLTDCPHREKLGWLEVSYLMGPSLLYDWDLRNFLPKVIRDIREAQTTSGLIPDIAPEYVEFSGGFRDSPEWGSAGIMLPWFAWQWYGDKQPLTDAYRTMRRYVDYLQSRTNDGLLTYGLGDWYDIAPGPPGPSKLTPQGLTATATYVEDLNVMRKTARLLDREADTKSFVAQAAGETAAFQKAFYQPEAENCATGSQTSLAMPLVIGLVPQSSRSALLEKLVESIRAAGNHTTAGDVGYRYVIEALMNAGRSDVIFDMATEKTPPSYAAQIAAGATSLTEAWDANPDSSQNHLMLGHIEEWFYGGLAGIRPDPNIPGLRHIVIDPTPVGDLQSVTASWDTFRGPVSVNWRVDGDVFRLSLDIPPGISADLHLPAASTKQVSASRDPNVQFLRQEHGRTVFRIGSGHYDFVVAGFARSSHEPGAHQKR
jgi:hypothetical protein